MNAFFLGLVTGILAVLPVGAVAVLILHKALREGFLPAAFGALGAATADTIFAAIAVWAGAAAIEVLTPHSTLISLGAGVVLIILGAWGFLRPPVNRATFQPSHLRGPALLVTFIQFFFVNCLNPLLIAFFFGAVVTAGAHDQLPDTISSLLFLVGVACSVFGWQVGLAWIGAKGTAKLSNTAQHRLSKAGHGIIAVVGIAMLGSALFSLLHG